MTTTVTTVRVTGMTCAACERRVTRALSGMPGVTEVTASAVRGRVTLTGTPPPDEDLRAALLAAGYTLGAPPWFSRDRRAWAMAGVAAAAVLAVGWAVARSGLQAPTPDASPGGPAGELVLALLVGLAAGVSTCMALVGGLVLGVSASHSGATGDPGGSGRSGGSRAAVRPHLVFTAGRIAGFAVGGAALGALGSAARLPDAGVAAAAVVAAVVMALLGVRLTGLSPRLSGVSLTLPGRWADRIGLQHDRGLLTAGAATFLLPCGFTQAMQLYSISLGSPARAAAVMAAFAIGTTPGLLGLGTLGSLSGGRLRTGAVVRVIGVVVLGFAVVTGTGGLRALGVDLPRPPGSEAPALALGTVSANVRLSGDVQVVTITETPHGYLPAHTTVWAGVPIRWTVDATAAFSCAAFLRIPSLGVAADLTTEGRHVIDVPALEVGTTRFTCVMGMYDGSFRAIPRPA